MDNIRQEDFVIEGMLGKEDEALAREPITYMKDAWRRFKKNKVALSAGILLTIIVLLTIFVPIFSKYDVSTTNMSTRNLWPCKKYIFGTDTLGRDLFTRVCAGGRVSIVIGIAGAFIVAIVGCIYGGIAAYFGGVVDNIMMRIVDILNSVPNLLVVIMMSIVLDSSSIGTLLFAMTITGWCSVARIVRAQMLQISNSEYVMCAKIMGVPPYKIVFQHFIPNTLSVIIVNITFRIPGFIFSEAFLSYVGLGVQPPDTSWGALASTAQSSLLFYPFQMFFPALFIALTMLCFSLIGDGLRDAFDPRLRR